MIFRNIQTVDSATGVTRYGGTFGPATLRLDDAAKRAHKQRLRFPEDERLASCNPEIPGVRGTPAFRY
jgi:hypothetical protein